MPNLHSIDTLFFALSLLALLLVAGLWIRVKLPIFARLQIPGAVIAGVLGLALGSEVLGAAGLGTGDHAQGLWGDEVSGIWRALPSILINLVFACLFLRKTLPSPREIWRQAGPVICFGQTVAWGQYMIGGLVAVAFLVPVYGMPPQVAALIEISFEGGHGTASGLAPVFETLDFREGLDLALGLASMGLLGALVSGVILVNWARRRGILDTQEPEIVEDGTAAALLDSLDEASPPTTPQMREPNRAIDTLTLHLGLVALSVLIGHLLLVALKGVETPLWGGSGLVLVDYVPLFPMAMVGGALVQMAAARFGAAEKIDREMVNRIGGTALDFVIVAALSTISLKVIADNLVPFLSLAVAGIVWNLFGFLWLAPRLLGPRWFQHGIPNFGQSMGMTVTGIMLFQMVDPANRSGGLERFGYKQLLFEPIVGGGLFTAMAMPLIAQFGLWAILVLAVLLTVFWFSYGLRLARIERA